MKLSMAAELAVRGVLVLAANHGRGLLPLEKICHRRKLPKQYLTKIFAALTKAGLVTAVRGRGGGYALAREPRKITLLEVIEAIEGPLAVNLCQHDPPRCQEVNCPLRPVWADVQEKVHSALASWTLEQLVRNEK